MDFSTVKDLIINNQPVIKLQVGNIIIWEKKSSGNWILDESGYIIGDDGKCYQRFYDDSNMIDNNPVPDLNAQWVEDTVSGSLNIDSNYDYFMSNSNYNVHNSYAQFKVSWNNLEEVNFLYRSYAESSYDYLVINGLDKPKFTSKPSYSTSGILAHTRSSQTTTYKTINVKTPDKGEHFIWFCYVKDSSGNSYSDRAFVGIPNNYKIGELLEKQGEELEYEYLISGDIVLSENDGYIRYKYYKTYFTPNRLNTIKTEDYILGEDMPATPISRNYLRFDATNGDLHIGVNALDLFNNLEYSKGFEESWTPFTTDGIDVPNGSSVYFRAQGMSATGTERGFTTNIGYECHGNIMSLLGDNFENNTTINNSYSFYGLFKNTAILTAPELPAKQLQPYCYQNMFYGCTSLVNVPVLPAVNIKQYCYSNMFNGCTSLVNAPVLRSTVLQPYCYENMFQGCTSLVNAPALSASIIASGCYSNMFQGCTSLVNAPALPATTLASSCYQSMFQGCTSLVNAPALPATKTEAWCYQEMFRGCTSLVNAPELPAVELDPTSAYRNMFYGCSRLSKLYCNAMKFTNGTALTTIIGTMWLNGVAATGTFYKNPDWDGPTTRNTNTVPVGWTIVDWTDEEYTPDDVQEVAYSYGNTNLYSNRPYYMYIHTNNGGFGYDDWYRYMNHNFEPVTDSYKEIFYIEKGTTGFYIYKKDGNTKYYIDCQPVTSDTTSDLYIHGNMRYTTDKPQFEFYYGDTNEILCTTPSGLSSGYKLRFRGNISNYNLVAYTDFVTEKNFVSFQDAV